jgi:hypothetical protein
MASKKKTALERRVEALVERCQEAMLEAIRQECDPYDGQVYMAGKRDVYVGHVIVTLEDLGIKVPMPKRSTDG